MNYCDRIITDKNWNTIVQNDPFEEGFVYVYILQRNRSTGIVNELLVKETEDSQVIFKKIREDGFYTLCTIKISTDERFPYYYKDGKFYKNIEQVPLQEIIDVNPEVSKVEIDYQNYFQVCRLKKCYINYCQQIFDKRLNLECKISDINSNLIYKRDLVWSALNVIKYMTELDQYEEAERLLERITGCNGLCDQSDSNGGCGCGNRDKKCGCMRV